MSVNKTLLAVLALVMALTLAVGPLGLASAQVANCTEYHTVARGETLAIIAAKYDTTWRILADINNISNPNLIFSGTRICVKVSATTPTPGTPAPTRTPAPVPTISIVSVDADKSVTIRTANYPANMTFDVLWGEIGTRGVNGIKSGTVNSGAGGSFLATLNIPTQMQGKRVIAIRLESTTTAHHSYNWFYNQTSAATTPGTPVPTTPAATPAPVPTFSITSVTKDTSVTIRTANFPANRTFTVYMGVMGTRGINGVNVGTLNSGEGGALTATYNIPASLQGDSRIAIRLESASSGHFSYNWFYNSTAP
jgi:LysM repeat protein